MDITYIILHLWVFCLRVYVCWWVYHVHARYLQRLEEDVESPETSYMCLLTAMWVLETKPRSSGRPHSAPNCWDLCSLHPHSFPRAPTLFISALPPHPFFVAFSIPPGFYCMCFPCRRIHIHRERGGAYKARNSKKMIPRVSPSIFLKNGTVL